MDVLVTKDAFERWDESRKLRFVRAFRDAYDAEKGIAFEIYPATLMDKDDFDFTLKDDSGKILKVQHTFAGADPALEYVDEKLQYAVVANVRARLKGLSNLYVSLGFRILLKNKSDAESLAIDIEAFVRGACNNVSPESSKDLTPLRHFRYTDDQIPSDLGSVTSYLTSIDVYSNESNDVMVGYGGIAAPRLTDDLRADMAIGNKEGHYASPEDLVLIVHYNTPFFGEFYEPVIREQHKDSHFAEIWLFDAWKDRFINVK